MIVCAVPYVPAEEVETEMAEVACGVTEVLADEGALFPAEFVAVTVNV